MKYTVFAASVFCVAILSSCGQNEGGGVRIEAAKPSLPTLSTPSNSTPVLPGSNQAAPIAPIIASSKLNPAHGQPGHRCDIAVGSPLPTGNTPALTTPTTTPTTASLNTTVSPTAPVIQPQPVTATTAAGLNPAHGQPSHRCDIPVGQPLNSKPQPANPAGANATPTTTVAQPTPVKPDGNLAKGLNPAHGLPGHRCDIAVGQPLTTPKKS